MRPNEIFVAELPALKAALTVQVAASPPSVVTPDLVDAYVSAISRKCSFARLHLRVLDGINWSIVDGLGRAPRIPPVPDRLLVDLEDAILDLRHPTAVADHVYLAMDGLTAAVVNMTDTFARLVNVVYNLGIPERQASLFAVRQKCLRGSSLGSVLYDPLHIDWLSCVKDLRGRCQHADVEGVLLNAGGSFARRAEPLVPRDYCWRPPVSDLPVGAFAKAAAEAAESTLVAGMRAVMAKPSSPTT